MVEFRRYPPLYFSTGRYEHESLQQKKTSDGKKNAKKNYSSRMAKQNFSSGLGEELTAVGRRRQALAL